jgi:hypothetical protein
MVPTLVNGSLRIKTVNQEEFRVLNNRNHLLASFEKVEPVWSNKVYFFGSEPCDLNDSHAIGILVSSWKRDKRITQCRLNYSFARAALCVYGKGYGKRNVSDSIGMNVYVQTKGRGTNRCHPSPLVADEEIAQHQYYNQHQGDVLSTPHIRATLNNLVQGATAIAHDHNPYFMTLVGPCCSRSILTTGHIPKPQGKKKKGGKRTVYSLTPTTSWVCFSHVDINDALTAPQVRDWLAISRSRKWVQCQRFLEEADPVCLPTTCGYQFCYADDEVKDNLEVRTFFSMEGLGLAMNLEDGISHHFMGAAFSHHTCLSVIQRMNDNKVNCSNSDDSFLIVAWGNSGTKAQVRAAATNRRTRNIAGRVVPTLRTTRQTPATTQRTTRQATTERTTRQTATRGTTTTRRTRQSTATVLATV